MRTTFPIVPIAVTALLRAFAVISGTLGQGLKAFVRARRNRANARILAGLERRELADIGITLADLRDAFSEPFWEDPTALLRERALDRRLNRPGVGVIASNATGAGLRVLPARSKDGMRLPPLDRPTRQTI